MKLPGLTKDEKQQRYLALLLQDESITAVIFAQNAGQANILSKHTEHFISSLEEADMEEWLDTFDKAISIAENAISNQPKLEKTIFTVKESWIEDGKIKKEYLTKLKKTSDELGLVPIGFLVFSEVVLNYLEEKEEIPVSAIFVVVGTKNVTTMLIRAGKVIEQKSGTRETYNLPQISDHLLQHFSSEIFPPRMLVLNNTGEENTKESEEELKQDFMHHSFSKTLPFLHVPQIQILPPSFAITAVLHGAASQLGFTVSDTKPIPQILTPSDQKKENTDKNSDSKQPKEPETEELPFGFVKDQDVADLEPEDLGQTSKNPIESEEELESLIKKPSLSITALSPFLERMKNFDPKQLKDFSKNRFHRLLFLLPLLLVFFLLFFVYKQILHTTVVLALQPKTITSDTPVTFTQSGSTDPQNNIIAASTVTQTESGSVQTQATGTKNIGNKAQGTVTIFNPGDSTVTLPSGTTFTANDLNYTLDNNESIPSLFSSNQGASHVSVTAADFGTNYNIPSGTRVTITNQPSLIARTDSAFTGGNEKQVTVVSDSDLSNLKQSLIKKLEGQATQDSKSHTQANILPVILTEDVTKDSTDKNSGDQASSVTLNGTVTYTFLNYKQAELDSFAKAVLSQKISSDQELIGKNTVAVDSSSVQKSGNDVKATLTIKGQTIPKLSQSDIAKSISGKSVVDARRILLSLPQVTDATFNFSPDLPLPKSINQNANNITIQINTNG